MNDNNTKCLVYLDHNVLDSMIKDDPFKVKELLDQPSFIPVFSDENLKEIQKSKGYEDKFLNILKNIKAKHIKVVLDEKLVPTGQANIQEVDPGSALASYVETITPFVGVDYGLSGMLQKFYGGLQGSSYSEIFAEGANNLMQMLHSSLDNLKHEEGIDQNLLEEMNLMVSQLPEVLTFTNQQLSTSLDNSPGSKVTQFKDATGISPIILNNIKGSNVLLQIWDLVREKVRPAEMDLETFFGLKYTPWSCNPVREPTISEKVNAIYHQLNFLGYNRDSKMKIERRFHASFSDMTHAGMASFCHIFICRDEGLVVKAAAAYEYLKVGTQIFHLR